MTPYLDSIVEVPVFLYSCSSVRGCLGGGYLS